MKLIVDIPDEDCAFYISMYKGTSLEEELEKIKTKINSEDVDCQYEEDYAYSGGLQKAIEIIDNHIFELKGE